jgi:hypothetical protein
VIGERVSDCNWETGICTGGHNVSRNQLFPHLIEIYNYLIFLGNDGRHPWLD